MNQIKVTIDEKIIEVPQGTTILKAAKLAGIDIPSLCYHPDLEVRGMCRVCMVEVVGFRTMQAACSQPVSEGMIINTSTPEVREARKINLELILANHPQDCLSCLRNQKCELQALSEKLGIRSLRFSRKEKVNISRDLSTPSIIRDPAKCILCRRCVAVCHNVQGVGALYPINRGIDTVIAPVGGSPLTDVACALCGQCIHVCPVGAIYEVDDTAKVWEALANPDLHVVVQTAPAIRVAIGEEMGMPPGSKVTGKLIAALRKLGFNRVFDTDFTADLTILEEGNELLQRLQNGGTLPMITSCSPGWIKYIEHYYPELLNHLSTCKSPQQMFGALAKTFYAEKAGIPAEKIFVVSVMPCTAKKYECQRTEMNDSGFQDVDVVLTTRELGRMLREVGIKFDILPDDKFDDPLGISTGAGAIFGATGGVMEAALRTVYEVVTGSELTKLEFEAVRGMEAIKEASVDLNGTKIKVAVAHGLANAQKILEQIQRGTAEYQFVEIMCCPGGCIGGGGQPFPTNLETRTARIKAIYEEDQGMPIRKSHQNPAIKTIYEEFLGEPLGDKSHHLLHTHYTQRGKY
jgi:iron-only hydrogenase group A